MSDTFKAFLKELDLPEDLADKPIDEVKGKFHEQFVARAIADSDEEIVNKITGKRMGVLTNLAKREFGLESSEIEGKKFEELITIASKKTKAQIEELKAAAEGKNPDAKEWETKIKAAQTERDQFKKMAEEKDREFGEFKQTAEQEKKGLKLGFALTGIKSKIEWSETANDLAKKGFDAHINENYKFDFDESGNLLAFDKSGNKVENSKKTGFLTPDEVYKAEAAKHGLLKLANPNPVKRPGERNNESSVKTPDGYTRRLPKAAEENAAR